MIINIFHEDITDEKLLPFVINSPLYNRSALQKCSLIIHNQVLWDEKDTPAILRSLSKKYYSVNRFVIVFIVSDHEEKYKAYPNLIVLRTSLIRKLKGKNEFVLPYIWENLPVPFPAIVSQKPSIGFCGLVSTHRQAIIDCFGQSPAIRANFILRDKFWAGSPHDPQVVHDFNKNLQQNPFIIAQRGSGNFSMRFYQTLAAGRIPVLVNTDMVLPFEEKIPWNKFIVFENSPQECLAKVMRVFESGEYIKMQQYCHLLYNAYFSDKTFLERVFEQIISVFLRA